MAHRTIGFSTRCGAPQSRQETEEEREKREKAEDARRAKDGKKAMDSACLPFRRWYLRRVPVTQLVEAPSLPRSSTLLLRHSLPASTSENAEIELISASQNLLCAIWPNRSIPVGESGNPDHRPAA